jgi:hypothetical protein
MKQKRPAGEVRLLHLIHRLQRNPAFNPVNSSPALRFLSMRNTQAKPAHALISCSLWLQIGFIGASALAAGLLKLFDGGWTWVWSLALAIAGGVLTAASWRRSRIALVHAGWASATSTGETSALAVSANPPQTGRSAAPVASDSAANQLRARSCP